MILEDAIYGADDIQRDIVWSLLKRKDTFGIKRKLVCISWVLDVDTETVLEEAIKDEAGRVLDRDNRFIIHDALLEE